MENRYIHFGIVLGLIAAISAGLLGGVNGFTSKVIAANTLKIVNEARKQVLPTAASFKEDEEAHGRRNRVICCLTDNHLYLYNRPYCTYSR